MAAGVKSVNVPEFREKQQTATATHADVVLQHLIGAVTAKLS